MQCPACATLSAPCPPIRHATMPISLTGLIVLMCAAYALRRPDESFPEVREPHDFSIAWSRTQGEHHFIRIFLHRFRALHHPRPTVNSHAYWCVDGCRLYLRCVACAQIDRKSRATNPSDQSESIIDRYATRMRSPRPCALPCGAHCPRARGSPSC